MSEVFTPREINLSAYTLYQHQTLFIQHSDKVLNDETGKKYLYSSPTGSGKSLMFLARVARDPFAWGITPRLEIIRDMLVKCGHTRAEIDSLNTENVVDLALEYRITTPIRMRNMLAKGTFPVEPRNIWRLIVDEAHHFSAETYQQIIAYVPWVTVVGLTATPYRGTPKGTAEFYKLWDEITPIMSVPEAAERGVISIPDFVIWPLVDDDQIQITNGEFHTAASAEATESRYAELVRRIEFAGMVPVVDRRKWNTPTLFAVSSQEQANTLAEYLNSAGMPATAITQGTTASERSTAFRECLAGETAIVQIDVVSEGVDLAIRRIIDLRPTMSPNRWMQLIGREMRPGGQSVYICCNRNIERHAYLFEGMIPSSKIAECQTAFGGPSARSGMRVVGLEGLGRFSPGTIHYADGVIGAVYSLYAMEGSVKREFGVVLHPNSAEPIYAEKVSEAGENGERQWGKWRQIDAIPDIVGFASSTPSTLSDKQKQSYTRYARRWGFDVSHEPNRKSIQAYFIMRDLFPGGYRYDSSKHPTQSNGAESPL